MFLDHHHDSNYMLFHHDESNNLQALLEILIAGGLLAPWVEGRAPELLFPNATFVVGAEHWQFQKILIVKIVHIL